MSLNKPYQLVVIIILLFLVISPAQGNIVVLNGLTHETNSKPGENYRRNIEIQNAGAEARTVKVYIRDYWYSYNGESRHDDPGTQKRSNAEWISFSPKLLTLQANEKVSIGFEVDIPNNDSLIGTYWSVIMVEGMVPQDTVASEGVKIHTAIRYAVQVITNIGNTGVRDLKFVGMELTEYEGKNILNIAVENTGERILKPELSLEVFDKQGSSIGVFKAERRKAYPTTSILLELPLVGIKPGEYNAVLVANCDEDNIFGTNFMLEI